jgi:hypothetical protein
MLMGECKKAVIVAGSWIMSPERMGFLKFFKLLKGERERDLPDFNKYCILSTKCSWV